MKITRIPLCLVALALVGCASEAPQPAASAAPAAPAAKAAEPAAPAAAPATEMVADPTADAAPAATASDTTAAATSGTAQMAEIGCASCIYHLEGVATCTPAIDLAGTVVHLEAAGVDPHGLCEKPKKVKVEGELKEGTFVATKLEFIEP